MPFQLTTVTVDIGSVAKTSSGNANLEKSLCYAVQILVSAKAISAHLTCQLLKSASAVLVGIVLALKLYTLSNITLLSIDTVDRKDPL